MKRKPIVAIVGRPNVGKSTFVNRLLGKRHSIVDDQPGVTRDRIYTDVEWQNKWFTVIDTGGIIPDDDDEIMNSIFDQAKIACEEADKIIFVVDGKDGVHPVDEAIANILRMTDKPVFLVVNKIDSYLENNMCADFYSLAIGEPHAISALHGSGGVGDILELITEDFEINDEKEDDDGRIKIAIVGRPNVGKSSLLNALLNKDKAIVTDIAGTTRDVIEDAFEVNGIKVNILDTAGIRNTDNVVELLGVKKSIDLINKADIVLFIVDSSKCLDSEDAKILSMLSGKKYLTIYNKVDKYTGVRKKDGIYTSCVTGEGINKIKQSIYELVIKGRVQGDGLIITSTRHFDALQKAKQSLILALDGLNRTTLDAVSVDLNEAYVKLGEITGNTSNETILDSVFSKFCLGK